MIVGADRGTCGPSILVDGANRSDASSGYTFPPMNRHADHVRRLCAEGRIPWAHAYVDRLIEDNPDDPEAAQLKAMIEEPPPAPAPQRPVQPTSKSLRVAGNLAALLGWIAVFGLVKWGMTAAGNEVARGIDLPSDDDGDSTLGLLTVVGAGWVVYLIWQVIKTRRSGVTVREALGRKKARSRATAAGLDDANMRLRADQHGTFLSFTGILAVAPRGLVPTWDPAVVPRIWPALMALGIFAFAWRSMGREQLVRAFRLSGFLVCYTVVALALVLAFAVFPAQLDVSGAAGPYIFGWGVLGWLIPAPFLFVRMRRMKRGGHLQLPAHWRR